MNMPGPGAFYQLAKSASTPALQTRLNDMATRILSAWYKFGMDQEYPKIGVGLPVSILHPHENVDARDKASKPARFQAAVEGHVLVKNKDKALPLSSLLIMSLYGYNARSATVNYHNPVLGGLIPMSRWNMGLEVAEVPDIQLATMAAFGAGSLPNAARKGHLFSGGGSGTGTPSFIAAPFDVILEKAIEDDTLVYWDFESDNPSVHPNSEVCLVFLNEFASEATDRSSLADARSDTLVQNVAKKCKNTIVSINNAGIRLVDAWIEHPNVTAVMFSHLPGQDSGRALVELLYGQQSPSGRLPYTVAKQASDYGAMENPTPSGKGRSKSIQHAS
jgi:beta-glucosidase